MAIRLPRIVQAKKLLKRSFSANSNAAADSIDVPKGYIAVYVGESYKKRYVIPIDFLNQPCFQELVSQAEQEFGFDHPMGGLTFPCPEDIFVGLTSRLSRNTY